MTDTDPDNRSPEPGEGPSSELLPARPGLPSPRGQAEVALERDRLEAAARSYAEASLAPSTRRAYRADLDPSARLRVSIDHLADEEQERITAALPFVGGLRIEFSREWPAAGVNQGRPGHFTRTYPWAECWPLHGALATEFSLLRAWTEVLESGEVALTAYGGEFDRWSRHIQDVTVPMMRRIGQLCALSGTTVHVDPAVPRPGSGAARSHRWGRPVHGAHAIHHEMGGHAAECDPRRPPDHDTPCRV